MGRRPRKTPGGAGRPPDEVQRRLCCRGLWIWEKQRPRNFIDLSGFIILAETSLIAHSSASKTATPVVDGDSLQ
jgi:hypothetical protein